MVAEFFDNNVSRLHADQWREASNTLRENLKAFSRCRNPETLSERQAPPSLAKKASDSSQRPFLRRRRNLFAGDKLQSIGSAKIGEALTLDQRSMPAAGVQIFPLRE